MCRGFNLLTRYHSAFAPCPLSSVRNHTNWLKPRGNVLALMWEWGGFQAQLDHGSGDALSMYSDSQAPSICGASHFHGYAPHLPSKPAAPGTTDSNFSAVVTTATASVARTQGRADVITATIADASSVTRLVPHVTQGATPAETPLLTLTL